MPHWTHRLRSEWTARVETPRAHAPRTLLRGAPVLTKNSNKCDCSVACPKQGWEIEKQARETWKLVVLKLVIYIYRKEIRRVLGSLGSTDYIDKVFEMEINGQLVKSTSMQCAPCTYTTHNNITALCSPCSHSKVIEML